MANHPEQFARIVVRLSQMDPRQLSAVEATIGGIERIGNTEKDRQVNQSDAGPSHSKGTKEKIQVSQSDAGPSHSKGTKDWPRSPIHRLVGKGAFIVTAGTYRKSHYFRGRQALDRLETELLAKAMEYDWQLESWAVFSNHYHFVGQARGDAKSLRPMLNHLHSDTARWINERDDQAGRQVWYNFWDTELTYLKSYQARLHYVHRNAAHHGLVHVPNQYPWCSAAWFERNATPAQVKTIYSFKTDKVNVYDDFEPIMD